MDWYGVNADKMLVDKPADKAGIGEQGGVVRMIKDTFELTSDLATADVIYLGGLIPKGAKIHDVHLFFDDLDGSGGTVDVGWLASAEVNSAGTAVEAADTDGFFDAADVATAADCFKASDMAAAQLAKWKGRTFAGAVQPVLVTDGDTDVTSGTIILEVLYILD